MVYIYCEDDKGGLHLIHLLNAIYFDKRLVVRSLKGIYKLGRKIEDIAHMIDKSDHAVIIYDNSPGNKCVKNELELAYEKIKELKIDNVYFIPIICMEYEILAAYGIKAFVNKRIHSIIDDLSQYRENISFLKSHLKSDDKYKIYRARLEARIQKRYALRCLKLNINVPFRESELNQRITMEGICKEIMTDGFQNELIIDKPDCLGKCWLENCCIKKSKICNISDNEIATGSIDSIDKQRYLMCFSNYYKVAVRISEITGLKLQAVAIEDIEKIKKFIGTERELLVEGEGKRDGV